MADLGATSLLYTARPRVSLEGEEDPALGEALLTLSVRETTAGLYCCEVTFGNWGTQQSKVDFLYFDRQVFDFGRRLSIDIGDGDASATIFDGYIMAIEGRYPQTRSPELLLLAEDRLQDLRMTRRTRTFEETSDQDVIEQIASEHGLQTDVDIDGPQYPVLAQVNQSDLAFLSDRTRSVDAQLWIEDETLHVQARARRRAEEITLAYGQGLHEFAACADLACQRTSFAVSGWDVSAKETIDEEATESAIQAELNGGRSGSAVLAEKFGDRAERVVHDVPLSSEEATALAQALFRKQARRFVTGKAVAEGDGRIRVGTEVDLQQLGPLFDGKYFVTEANHLFDPQGGYKTCFRVERAGIGGA